MKYILVIGDGMADKPQAALDGKTPLEYASTPALDGVASQSVVGLAQTAPEGQIPGSDRAILEILGLWGDGVPSRSALEAKGVGIDFDPKDCLCRCNLVAFSDDEAFSEKRLLSHNGGGISGEEADALGQYLKGNPAFAELETRLGVSLRLGHSFRHLAVFREDVTAEAFAPPHNITGKAIGPYLPTAPDGISELLSLAYRLLDSHPINQRRRKQGLLPANGLWFWAPGRAGLLPDFGRKYGLRGAVVCGASLVRGIGAASGMTVPEISTATGGTDTDYGAKARAALSALQAHDFVLIHVEAPDEATHAGNLNEKVRAIENIDRLILGPILSSAPEPYRLLFISDHRSLLGTRTHGEGEVPFLLYDSVRPALGPGGFSEASAENGKILLASSEIMPALLDKTAAFY